MIRLHYRLEQENFKELNSYLALHDKAMQKRLRTITFSLMVFVIVLSYLIFRFSAYTIFMSIAGIFLIVCLTPRIYWNMVFKRADHFVENAKVTYSDMDVEIGESIQIKEHNRRIVIAFDQIVNFDYTKNNCIVFYRDNGKVNTLLLPVNSFSEEQLKEFHARLTESRHGETGNH